jgi:sugar lactone lactonase YvrE
MAIDSPGASPRVVASGISNPGGLLMRADGDLIVGQGNGLAMGAAGNVIGLARLLQVDPDTGATSEFATGLSMANGLASGPDGEIYASDSAGTGIDRVVGGQVERNWASVISSNGLAVDSAGRYLFAAQTFQPAAIQRVSLDDSAQVQPHMIAAPTDVAAGLDGMAIDQHDRLFVAANGGGQVWRIGNDGSYCAFAQGLLLPSAVAFGSSRDGSGFSAESLFAVTFSGSILEFSGARSPDKRKRRNKKS